MDEVTCSMVVLLSIAMSKRTALIVCNNSYQDKTLSKIAMPQLNLHNLDLVLRVQSIGNFNGLAWPAF